MHAPSANPLELWISKQPPYTSPDQHKLLDHILRTSLLKSWVLVIFFTLWATCISLICDKLRDLSIETTLLTVFGTILGFVISFRTSSAFERYNEGKKLLASIAHATRTFARLVRFNVPDKPTVKPAESKDPKSTYLDLKDPELTYLDLLGEHHRRTAIQLVKQFSVAVKDYLYDKQEKDHNVMGYLLRPLKNFRQRTRRALTIQGADDVNQSSDEPEMNRFPSSYSASQMEEGKLDGDSLTGCPASQTPSQPGAGAEGPTLKPLEITFCLSAYVATLQKFSLDGPTTGGLLGALDLLVEAFTDLEKVSSNKIPFSYRCQMWGWIVLYLFFLPFQIWRPLRYLTIPATSIAAFIFLGLHAAGEEIENPFDNDPNDLRLREDFCKPLSDEITRLEYPSDFDSNPQQPWASSNRIDQILKGIETNQEENKKTKAWIKEGFNKCVGALDCRKQVKEDIGGSKEHRRELEQ